MVRALHAAGIEVILDVVYNHTAEGDETGPTLCFRGIDNAGYYRLAADDRAATPTTPAAATPSTCASPHVLQLIMDSLRYWVTEMHVDGFRFDLASALARSLHDVDMLSAFFDAIHQDPVLRRVKLIAEPWDVGDGGYQVGEFPPLWTEWNDKYRDTVRDFWRGARIGVRELGYRLTGSSDLYARRRPAAVRLDQLRHRARRLHAARPGHATSSKHNEANGEDNRDGDDDNRSWNCGVEGETDDPAVTGAARAGRSATCSPRCCCRPACRCSSPATRSAAPRAATTTPTARTTRSPGWTGTLRRADGGDLLALTRRLVALRRGLAGAAAARRSSPGRPVPGGGGRKDLAWFTAGRHAR